MVAIRAIALSKVSLETTCARSWCLRLESSSQSIEVQTEIHANARLHRPLQLLVWSIAPCATLSLWLANQSYGLDSSEQTFNWSIPVAFVLGDNFGSQDLATSRFTPERLNGWVVAVGALMIVVGKLLKQSTSTRKKIKTPFKHKSHLRMAFGSIKHRLGMARYIGFLIN